MNFPKIQYCTVLTCVHINIVHVIKCTVKHRCNLIFFWPMLYKCVQSFSNISMLHFEGFSELSWVLCTRVTGIELYNHFLNECTTIWHLLYRCCLNSMISVILNFLFFTLYGVPINHWSQKDLSVQRGQCCCVQGFFQM